MLKYSFKIRYYKNDSFITYSDDLLSETPLDNAMDIFDAVHSKVDELLGIETFSILFFVKNCRD